MRWRSRAMNAKLKTNSQSTQKGWCISDGCVGKELLKREEVIYVGKSIGQHTIDLRVQTVLEDNAEILRMMELLKATPGIKDVVWTEIVEVVGRKMSIPSQIVDRLCAYTCIKTNVQRLILASKLEILNGSHQVTLKAHVCKIADEQLFFKSILREQSGSTGLTSIHERMLEMRFKIFQSGEEMHSCDGPLSQMKITVIEE